MTQTLENAVNLPEEQRFFRHGLTWEQFKAIQASFENVPGVRLFYCQGILEIVSIGKPHEAIKCLTGLLVGQYFVEQGIEFFPSGSFSQIIPEIVEYQADLSYCFGTDKPIPDLCIEVVITSGSPIKLQKYKLMQVPEVWFWEENLNHPENQQIREISVTPVLLLLTCLVFETKKMVPINRSQLYEEGLEILLKKWDETKGIKRDEVYRNLTLLRKKKLLSHAAIKFFEQGKYFFQQDDIQLLIAEYISTLPDAETDLEELLENSEAVLKSIEEQHGLLVERAQKIYSFSHLTFQEYFSALNFVNSSNQKDFQQLASHITQKRWREIFLLTDGILRNSDLLWWQIKQYIDAMIASDINLQDFLVWVNEKTCSVGALRLVQNPYKANSVRSVYFAHHLSLDIDLAVTLDPVLAPTRELALNFQRKPILDDARDINIARQVERDVGLDIVLYHALYHENLNASLDMALARAIDRSIDVALDLNQAHKLNECLRTLQNELPNKGRKTSDFNQWWESHGQDWTEQLRTVMIKYCKIGKDWQFCDEQKKLLKQYYYANQLLVDCLENAYNVSTNEKDKIKETLLLPMIESKKIYPNFSS